ncbi:hypothetical protein LguiB_032933 [Lonicera macranthoides]
MTSFSNWFGSFSQNLRITYRAPKRDSSTGVNHRLSGEIGLLVWTRVQMEGTHAKLASPFKLCPIFAKPYTE